ncbi:MAG: GDP-L-fucose synthase, partial [Gammaproteobacteria bacterium]|nr:GDP-L-fucose synthase [Gammaproteobacteria bacterium]
MRAQSHGKFAQRFRDAGYSSAEIVCPRRRDYDLTRLEDVRRLFKETKPHLVIHAAADIGGIGYSKTHPGSQLYNNTLMNTYVLDESFRAGVEKFVGIGTVCSYPKFTNVPFREEDLWLGYPEETNAAYGLSKKMMLEQSKAYRQQYGFNAVHLLLINLYGPRDDFHPENSHVIPALIRKIDEAVRTGADEIVMWGDGSPTREFLFAEDCAEAVFLAAELYDGAEPVNIGCGDEISIRQLVELVSQLMGFDGRVQWDTTRPNGQPRRQLDVSRAKDAFGFSARTDFTNGLRRTIEWYRTNVAS